MKGISKKACRDFLEPLIPPNSDCGIFLIKRLKYIIRTTVKNIGHRRLLVLCLYARGETPGSRPVLTFSVFQAGNTFITYDHRPDVKTRWRTAMMRNLESTYHFLQDECAFYSRPDEQHVIKFCKRYVPYIAHCDGLWAVNTLQDIIRERETMRRKKERERKIRDRMKGLRPLPGDMEPWLRQSIVPAYFFYKRKRRKGLVKGICSACGQEVELADVKHNADGVCPHCGRGFKMKSEGKRGYIWDRTTASVVQKFQDNALIIRIIKAYSTWRKGEPQKLDWYEETRIIITRGEDGGVLPGEAYHESHESLGITSWKKGLPPVMFLYQQNFNAETCGALYCRNLKRELAGTPWQYCQLLEFYQGSKYEEMEVAPYLRAYFKHPRMEHLVKVGFHQLVSDIVYRGDYSKVLDESRDRTHQILKVTAEDIPFLKGLDINLHNLEKFQQYCALNLRDRQRLLAWQIQNEVEYEIPKVLEYVTPHKMMRFLDEQYPAMRQRKSEYGGERYHNMQDVVREYRDYLEMCVKEKYDMRNSFILFPEDLQIAHDRVAERIKVKADRKMRRDFQTAYRRIMSQLDFETEGMKIVYPATPEEIVAEGHALHHCVGSYVDRVAKRECIILFLRKAEQIDKPYYTIEVRNKKVVQVRGMNNTDATPEVEKFMAKWKKKVLNRPAVPKAA